MLSHRSPLFFPKLIQEGTCVLNRRKEVDPCFEGNEYRQSLGLFRLDWHEQEDRIKRHHDYWRLSQHPDKNIPFMGSLPAEYDEKLKGMKFAISECYLEAILWNSHQGLAEWNRLLPFDTIIRDMCVKPAQAHIAVAFGLVADCLYDQEQQYWDRSELKQILKQISLAKFWAYQTGRRIIPRLAELTVLERRAASTRAHHEETGAGCLAYVEEIEAFLVAFKEYTVSVEESYAPLHTAKVPISGPSL